MNENIKSDVYKVFKNHCFMTGEEIKNTLSIIYSSYGIKFYPQIKTLEKFGYNLRRFLNENRFIYEITKIKD